MDVRNTIRICHCNHDNKNCGGGYLLTRRVETELRKYGYVFDYLSMDEFTVTGDPEIDLLPGSKGYGARLRKNRWSGHIKLPFYAYSVFKKNRYPVVHVDIDLAWKALLYAIPAKLTGSKVVVHSHSTGIDGDHKKLKSLAHNICRQILPMFTDRSIACSSEAAQWLFPKRMRKNTLVLVNGTDFNRFYFDKSLRKRYRKNMVLNDKLVIGNIGLVCRNKNQIFLVQVLSELIRKGINSELLIIGTSTDETDSLIRDKALQLGVAGRVRLLGRRTDTNALLNAMDVYICPSFIEGAPLTLYEAQATGLPCLMSDTVSDDAVASDYAAKVSLKAASGKWAEKALHLFQRFSSEEREHRKPSEQYSLSYMADRLSEVYEQLT